MRIAYGFAAVTALVAAQLAYYVPRLPARMASHFGGDCTPNGYMSKDEFVWFYVGSLVFLFVVFGAVALLLRFVPTSLVNLPNKDYWFSPEREAGSRTWLARELGGFGAVVALFLVAIMQRVLMANTDGAPPCLPADYVFACLGALVVAVGVMLFRLVRRFS